MSSDLQTMDKQNQKVDSSEQYAINVMGERALQSADYVMKKSKETMFSAIIRYRWAVWAMPAPLLTGGLPTRSPATPGIHTLVTTESIFPLPTATVSRSMR